MEEEVKQITIFVPKDDDDLEDAYSERLCLWEGGVDPETADKYTFQEFRRHLHLTCIHQEEAQNVLKFSPDNSTPSVVYGNVIKQAYNPHPDNYSRVWTIMEWDLSSM